MGMMRQIWLGALLLLLGLGPLVLQASVSATAASCCCASSSAEATCRCDEHASESSCECSLQNAPDYALALEAPQPDPRGAQELLVLALGKIVAALWLLRNPATTEMANLSAGWTLPTSPPLLDRELSLPPPSFFSA